MTELATIEAAGVLLTADTDTRVLRYRLLPYGEAGRTNVGMVTASAGTLTMPARAEDMHLNIGHDRNRPVGRGVNLDEDEHGLTAAFRIARTSTGDDLLAEAAEGLRPGVSVEIADPIIRAGRLLGGRLEHAGAVVEPAFPSAVLVAADAGPDPHPAGVGGHDDEDPNAAVGAALAHLDDHTDDDPTTDTTDTTDTTTTADEDADEDDTDESESAMTAGTATAPAAAPADLRASATPRGPVVKTAADLFHLMAEAYNTHDPVLIAALADITSGGTGGINVDIEQHQWLGELWSGRAYARIIAPLFNSGTLTSFNVDGWRWVTKPTMDYYSGDKTAVPSNAVDTEPQSVPAIRIAGAHDIDRKFRDFPNDSFWESYARAMVESYARKSDAKVLTDALAVAPAVTPGAVPAGVSKGIAAVVDGALAIIDTAIPSFAIMGKALYRDAVLTRSDDTLTYLNASLGLEDGTVGSFKIIPSAASALVGKVLVGAREAMTVHELPGSPIRAEALDMTKGGIDVGFFGYMADVVHDKAALGLVTTV